MQCNASFGAADLVAATPTTGYVIVGLPSLNFLLLCQRQEHPKNIPRRVGKERCANSFKAKAKFDRRTVSAAALPRSSVALSKGPGHVTLRLVLNVVPKTSRHVVTPGMAEMKWAP